VSNSAWSFAVARLTALLERAPLNTSAWSPLQIPGGEAPDGGAGDEGSQLGGGLGQPRGPRDPEGGGRPPHIRGAEGEGPSLGLQGVGAVAVPPPWLGRARPHA
jgi:hypothetical protein